MITMTDNDFAASLTEEQKDRIRAVALGRIFRLAARPEQSGDAEAYERAKRAFLATYTDEELTAMRGYSLPSPCNPVPRHPKDA